MIDRIIQDQAIRNAELSNNEKEQQINIISAISDPEDKAKKYKKVSGDCCDVAQSGGCCCGNCGEIANTENP